MRNLKKGFTLVELIVVITILAILGTIGFISLQGYSSDARNSKRTSDLGSIATAISSKVTGGMSLLNLLSAGTGGNRLTTPSIAGSNATAGTDYDAGAVNYTALGIKQADFQDPNGKDYVMGATSRLNGKYQLTASMEQGGGSYVAKVTGDYMPRTSVSAITMQAFASGVSTITLSGSTNVGTLVSGDTITGTAGIAAGTTIVKVSSDGTTLTLSKNTTASGSSAQLAAAETGGLIDSNTTTIPSGVIMDGLSTALPY